MEPLDLTKIDDFVREQTDQDNGDRFCRRYLYRVTRFGLGMLSWIPASAVLGILYLLSQELELGLSSVEYFTSTTAFALLVIHPIGAFSLLVSNLWTESLLPNRCNLVLHLISGACCFSDGVLSFKQTLLLCLTQMLSTASIYVCFAGSLILFTPYMNGEDKVAQTSHNGASFGAVVVFLCCGIPAILWYGLFRYCYYRCFRVRRRDLVGEYAHAYNQARQEEMLREAEGGPSASATGIEIV
jgi:hypothetical protein